MKKKVLRVWMSMVKAQWSSTAWFYWLAICILGMAFPIVSYPLQLLITSAAKAILSPIPQLADWTVRHDTIYYSDDMFFIACADCGRIFFVSCVISAVIEFFIAFLQTYLKKEKNEKIEA